MRQSKSTKNGSSGKKRLPRKIGLMECGVVLVEEGTPVRRHRAIGTPIEDDDDVPPRRDGYVDAIADLSDGMQTVHSSDPLLRLVG